MYKSETLKPTARVSQTSFTLRNQKHGKPRQDMDVIDSDHYELEEQGNEDEITQVSAYFDEKRLWQQLDSFENFQNIIQEMAADIEVQPDPISQSHSAEVVDVSKSVISKGTDGEEGIEKQVRIMLLHSSYCTLYQCLNKDLAEVRECPYFIVNGGERALTAHERMSTNHDVFKRRQSNNAYVADIRSMAESQNRPPSSLSEWEISPVVIAQATKIFVNGSWVGIHRNPEMLVRAFMKLRRQVDINTEVSVVRYIHLKELHIYTDCGRCRLPLFIVDNRLLIEKRDIFQGESPKNSGWRDLAEKGFIAAEDTTMISMTINDVVQSRLNPVEAYWNTYTHCEIHSVSTVNGKMLTGDGPHHEDTPLNVSSPVNRSISGNDLLTENVEEAKGDSDIGETSATFTSVKGTTTMAMIGHNAIYLATDQSGNSLEHEQFVLKDDCIKFFKFGPDILATMAGESDKCHEMLEIAGKVVTTAFGPRTPERVHLAALIVMAAMDNWEKRNPGIIIKAQFIIVGWHNEQPIVYTVRSKKFQSFGGITWGTHFSYTASTGNGKEAAFRYASEFPWETRSDLESETVVELAIIAAALENEYTGDRVHTAELPRDGDSCLYEPDSVLYILECQYPLIYPLLSKSLLFVCWNLDYSPQNESFLLQFLRNKFPNSGTHVISSQNAVIRIINFTDPMVASETWQEVCNGISVRGPAQQIINIQFFKPTLDIITVFLKQEQGRYN